MREGDVIDAVELIRSQQPGNTNNNSGLTQQRSACWSSSFHALQATNLSLSGVQGRI